jgi:hypothetical protein
MKPASAYAAMSDPDLNWQFSRRWVDPAESRDRPTAPAPKTLDNLSAELAIDWRRQQREV